MTQVLCLSDLHGAYFTMLRLLNAAPRGVRLVFGGDLIDRGPNSRAVVEFAMANAIPTVRANHDDLCLDFYRRGKCHEFYDRDVWLSNGGHETAANWPEIDRKSIHWRRDQWAGGRVPDAVLDWFEGLPARLFPSDELDANGLRLEVSHTGYGYKADEGDWFSTLWGRHEEGDGEFPDDGAYRVYGHTPQKAAVVTDRYACIDTGAAYTSRGYGVLSGLLWPSKVVLTQQYDESPVKPTFTIKDGCIEQGT